MPYAKPKGAAAETHIAARELDAAVRRAEIVAHTAANLKQLGFQPDIIIGHHGWGELLNLRDVWPDVPLLGYLEFYYCINGIDVGFDPEFPTQIRGPSAHPGEECGQPAGAQSRRAWPDADQMAALDLSGLGARNPITLLPEGVNLDVCKPNPQVRRRNLKIGDAVIRPNEKLVTYVARDLEPYRGFHVMMRACRTCCVRARTCAW